MTAVHYRPKWSSLADAIKLCREAGATDDVAALDLIHAALADRRLRVDGPLSLQGINLATLDPIDSTVIESRPGMTLLLRGDGKLEPPAGRSRVRIGICTEDLLLVLAKSTGTAPARPKNKGGRQRKYRWEAAKIAVFGQVFRGEVTEPVSQADLVRLLAQWFVAQNKRAPGPEPGATELKKHANELLAEINQ